MHACGTVQARVKATGGANAGAQAFAACGGSNETVRQCCAALLQC
jgi:hypothetical protein